MRTEMNKPAGSLGTKRLLAAIAVLAVAFVVLAAIPAVADDNDAAGSEKIVYVGNGGDDATGDGSQAKPYATIQKALTIDGVTGITLLSDMKLTGEGRILTISESITFDLGNHALTIESTAIADMKNGKQIVDINGDIQSTAGGIRINPTDSDVDLTMQNGTVKFTVKYGEGEWQKNHCAITIAPNGGYTSTVQLQNVNFESSEYAIYAMGSKTQRDIAWTEPSINVIVNGGSIKSTSEAAAISTHGNYGGEYVEIRNAKLISEKGPAIYAPSNGKLVVEDSELTGVSGIDQRSGSIEVKGDTTITYNGPDAGIGEDQYDGPVAFGVGVSVMPNYGYSHVGTSIVIEDSVKFVKGTNAGDQIFVSPMEYSKVTYEQMKSVEKGGAIGADTFVQYKGVALKYSMSESDSVNTNFPSFMTFSDSKIDLTVGAGSTAAISQNVTGKLTNNGVVQVAAGKTLDVSAESAYISGNNSTLYLASGATFKVPTGTAVSNVKAAADAKIFVGEEAQTLTENQKKSDVTNESEFIEAVNGGVAKITVNTDITLYSDIVIPEKTTVSISNGIKLTLANGKTLTVNGAITGTIEGKSADGKTDGVAKLEDFNGDFQVKAGSLEITGADLVNGKITVVSGNIVIDGKINGDIEFVNEISGENKANVIFRNTTIGSSATITLVNGTNITYQVEGAMNLYGSMESADDVQLTVSGDATFKAYSGAQISKVEVTGSGEIDLSQAQNPQTVSEDISHDKTYGQLENVTVVDSLTIRNNSKVTIMGQFNIDEGVTLTIEEGSQLIIEGTALVKIEGNLVIEENATVTQSGGKVSVYGNAEIAGVYNIGWSASLIAEQDSVITIEETGRISAHIKLNNLKVMDSANLKVGGTVTGQITAYGKVEFDSQVPSSGKLFVRLMVDGATVDVKNYVLGTYQDVKKKTQMSTLDIMDTSGLMGADGKVIVYTGKDNQVVLMSSLAKVQENNAVYFSGLTFTHKVLSEPSEDKNATGYYNGKIYEKRLEMSGTVSSYTMEGDEQAVGLLEIDIQGSQGIVVPETEGGNAISVGQNVQIHNHGRYFNEGKGIKWYQSHLEVRGIIDATDEDADFKNGATIDVTGSGAIKTLEKIITGTVNAVMFETKNGTETVYNYTTLKTAVDSGAKDITVLGTVKVDESISIPKDTTVKGDGTIVIGSSENTDVELVFADGAVAKNVKFDVDGTLYFENKKDNKASDIQSDVSVIGEKDARYTNVYTALAKANAGDTVTVSGDTVDLKKNITIKEGVTLDVPYERHLKVYSGVTVTVNGTLRTVEEIGTEQYTDNGETKNVKFDLSADKLQHKASIVVNGVFMSGIQFSYGDNEKSLPVYRIPGAYYYQVDSVGEFYYATTLENASKNAAADVKDIEIYGKVAAGDVTFTGTDSSPKTVTVKAGADLTAASITLDKATFVVETGRFTGDVKAGESAVTVKNVKGMTVSVVDDVYTVDGAANAAVSTKNETASFAVSAGSVYIQNADMEVTVLAGATLVSGTEAARIDGLTIEGTVAVANGQTITVDYGVIVMGTLSIAAATDSEAAGTFETPELLVGVDVDDLVETGDAASVSGAVSGIDFAIVKADATVSEATIDSFKDANGVLKSTTYVVEDKDWITVYYKTGEQFYIGYITKAPVENAKFTGKWLNTDGDIANGELVGASKCEKVTADVEYDIYTIRINVDAGLESIAIDGNLMLKDFETGMYTMDVKAGTHDITCKLANGYSGDAKFSLVKSVASDDGKIDASVSGNKVTVSGDEGTVYVQITGITSSGYTPAPVEPAQDKDDGLSLTDILLIILVVLIVVMAIIVALRLMRS